MRVVGIYNADAGLLGELRYVLAKLRGRADCELCDLTHGWNAFGKPAWRAACRDSPVRIEMIHRNQAAPDQLEAAGALPAILLGEDGAWKRAAGAKLIGALRKDPAALLAHLEYLIAATGRPAPQPDETPGPTESGALPSEHAASDSTLPQRDTGKRPGAYR